jgi:hypothetical protein
MPRCASDTSAQYRNMAAPDQLHIRDRMVGNGKGTGRYEGGAVAGAAGDAMYGCGINLDCAHI